MNNDEQTTENFWAVFNNLTPWEPPVVLWRLYHDDQGRPLFYSQEDTQGNYIDVTPEQYQRASMNVRVRNGQLVEIFSKVSEKLMPNGKGTACHPCDVAVVVPESHPHIKWSRSVSESD